LIVDQLTDRDLMERVASQDDAALGEVYDRYAGIAFALAYRTLGDRGQAEDVVQEAFLSLWRRAHTFDAERGNLKSWLMTIVRNAAIDRRRGRFRHEATEQNIDDHAWRLESDDVWGDVERNLTGEAVREALDVLPDTQREVIQLAYFGGLSQSEIAERTGLPLGTIKSRARLGLRKLHEVLQPAVHEQDTDG
jgi:RNA polymerase sigma-70 factor, ECF subfamily